jgi:hypothetical protein
MACYLHHQEIHNHYKSQITVERRWHCMEVQELDMELKNVRQETVSCLCTQTAQYRSFPLLQECMNGSHGCLLNTCEVNFEAV